MAANSVSKISSSVFKIQIGCGAEGKDWIRLISKSPPTGKVKDFIQAGRFERRESKATEGDRCLSTSAFCVWPAGGDGKFRKKNQGCQKGALPWKQDPACSISPHWSWLEMQALRTHPDVLDQIFLFRGLQVIHVHFRVWEYWLELCITLWIAGLHKAFQNMKKFWRKFWCFYGISPAWCLQALRHHFSYQHPLQNYWT